ncbi:hypothetical protein [Pararhodonellum marinum]|uniref:hypothetical protein n=1 Tax=Pararhodonellum marinum TaxID=2755358 RepID=UPI00188E28B6|nr:hypothetical protein [Pararhodonellum marinum]
MKKTILFLAASCLLSWVTFAQDSTSTEQATIRVRTFSLFDTNVTVIKNQDGSKTWEFEDKWKTYEGDEVRIFVNRKSSTGLIFDIGINSWVGDDTAPAVRPWGSWNPAINFYHQYRAGKNFHLKSTLGVSWYNFKFEERNLQALRTPDGLIFEPFEDGTGIKSKISASFANIAVIPTLKSNNGQFRIGAGPYAGYRLGGRGKLVYRDDNGNRRREFQKTNMFVNDFRYGGRLEIGVGDVDLFFNYDFNDLFQSDRGPKLNAISFGIIL